LPERYSVTPAAIALPTGLQVVDLGFGLDDIAGLGSEAVFYRENREAIIDNLRLNGAAASEIEFLLERRVKLNAMTNQLVTFIERKFGESRVTKVVPDADILARAWRWPRCSRG
jgi:hypothetical protein